jgi:hypothetical protein
MPHNKTEHEFTATIFKNFNCTYFENIDFSRTAVYNEKRCFEYNPAIIDTVNDYVLNGQFQNKQYITPDTIHLFENEKICNRLLFEYPNLQDSFFIHIRRGDYLTNNMYKLDVETYYTKAIKYICDKIHNPHFFILSDDTELMQKCVSHNNSTNKPVKPISKSEPEIYTDSISVWYKILENINKTIITQMTTLDSFYFMSMCKNGGICANSTFSGWASNMNKNENKIVIVPENWCNIDYDYEIPFNYTVKL